jgi:hypothetical protein
MPTQQVVDMVVHRGWMEARPGAGGTRMTSSRINLEDVLTLVLH